MPMPGTQSKKFPGGWSKVAHLSGVRKRIIVFFVERGPASVYTGMLNPEIVKMHGADDI